MDTTFIPTTRITLLNGLRDASPQAWDDFFAVYGPVIYRMARHAGLDEHAAEEIVGIVMRNFVSTQLNGFTFDPQRGRFRQYLRTLTNRSIRRYRLRKQSSTGVEYPMDEVADLSDPPDAAWQQAEREERWQACLERLRNSSVVSPRDFEAFHALVLGNEPAAKVAKRFGVTTNRLYGIKHTVIRHLQQIRQALDAELGEV